MSNESPVERIKKASKGLRGTLKESLLDEHTPQDMQATIQIAMITKQVFTQVQ